MTANTLTHPNLTICNILHVHGSMQLDTLLSQPLTVRQAEVYLSDYAEINRSDYTYA